MKELISDLGCGLLVNGAIVLLVSPVLVPLFLLLGTALSQVVGQMAFAVMAMSVVELIFPGCREENRRWANSILRFFLKKAE